MTRRPRSATPFAASVVFLAATLAFGCASPPHASGAGVSAVSSPPSEREALAALTAHASLDPIDESCTYVTGDPADVTLGAIEAHLRAQLANARAEGDVARATTSCAGTGPPWRCLFDVRIEGEDPWEYGISFALDAAGAIDPASVTCPGGS